MTRVLVVSEDLKKRAHWLRLLSDAGYRVESCGGPSQEPCPRFSDGSCALRERADVALVEVQHPGEPPYGEWGAHACTKLVDDGRTIFVADTQGPRGPGFHLVHPVSDGAIVRAVERSSRFVKES